MTDREPVPIIVDVRPVFGDSPFALADVGGRPYLSTLLDVVRDANALARTTVLARDVDVHAIEQEAHSYDPDISVVGDSDGVPEAVRLEIRADEVYVRHQLLASIRSGRRDVGDAVVFTLRSEADLKVATEFAQKDAPTHRTFILRHFYRPVSRRLAVVLGKVGFTPNGITFLALATVPPAVVLIAIDEYWAALAGIVLIHAFTMFDLADGYLARLTNRMSKFGYWFDSIVDTVFEFGIIIGFTAGAMVSLDAWWPAVPGTIWLVTFAVLHTNEVMSRDQPSPVGSSAPDLGSGDSNRVMRLAKSAQSSLMQPEIIRGIYTLGLAIQFEVLPVIFYGAFNTYLVVRMWARQYGQRFALEDHGST